MAVAGSVLAVQSVPFGDVAAIVPEVLETATKTPLPQQTLFQLELADIVVDSHVIPSKDIVPVADP